MSDTPMMECGHAANASGSDGSPCCAICIGIHPGAEKVAETPDFEGRTARCSYYNTCKTVSPSGTKLAFFEHLPDKEFDLYYCGCHGWN